MAEKVAAASELVLGGVDKIVITPYTISDGTTSLGEDTYTLTQCVENSTSITQEEGSSTDILNERKGIIKSLPIPGTRTFTTNSGDIQENILVGLFGYRKDSTTNALIAPISDPAIEAKVEVYFLGGLYKATCYRVAFTNSLTIESMSEGIAQGVITGKLLSWTVAAASGNTAADIREFSIDPITQS